MPAIHDEMLRDFNIKVREHQEGIASQLLGGAGGVIRRLIKMGAAYNPVADRLMKQIEAKQNYYPLRAGRRR